MSSPSVSSASSSSVAAGGSHMGTSIPSTGEGPGHTPQARRFKPVSGKSGRKPSKAAAIKIGSSLSAAGSSLSAGSGAHTAAVNVSHHPHSTHGTSSRLGPPTLNAPGPSVDRTGEYVPRNTASVSASSTSSRLHSLSRSHGTRIRMPPTRRPASEHDESRASGAAAASEPSSSDPLAFTIGDAEGFFPVENEDNTGGTTGGSGQSSEEIPKKRTLKDYCMDDENELVSSRFRKLHNERRKKPKTTDKLASFSSEANNMADTDEEDTHKADDNPIGPQVQLVNGRIVVSQESLTAPTTHDSRSVDDFEEIDEHAGRHITSKSFKTHGKSQRWSKDDTSAFYEALRICGTNFSMIASLFPNRTRRQVKAKYLREERQHPVLVDAALKSTVKMTTENFDYALEHGIHSMVTKNND
eukprot:gb/GECG01012111.1/.p1 GENE.gb/GECG01012111.1/~~gb/GECG01012111.1/.p1  ORF type:complete len:413 (+),score=67.76 gb/GECG01012111.1/:1-1239(+)